MSDINKIVKFIEEFYKFKLMDYQIEMLDAMLNGKSYSVPRRCGRTMILNGYKEYLDDIYGKHISIDTADINIKPIVVGKRPNVSFLDEYWSEWRQ